jgi:hypothetical protein
MLVLNPINKAFTTATSQATHLDSFGVLAIITTNKNIIIIKAIYKW